MTRLRSLLLVLRGSLWFLPALMLCAAVALAAALIEIEVLYDVDLSTRWPRLFGAGAEGARAMLAAIATSMITVAGVVFSITVVALSLASTQYSPRVLRNFMSDRPTQAVLGAFVGIFAYCLIVLRTIRSPDEGNFVPQVAVFGGVVMAFVGVGLLIYFVHHVASSIQVSSILSRISEETAGAIDRLFPAAMGSPAPADGADERSSEGAEMADLPAPKTGYLVGIDGDAMLALASAGDFVVRIVPRVGDFVIEGTALLDVTPAAARSRRSARALLGCVTVASQRTVHQDAPYGLQQIVDVALRALSPSVHDPTTAVTCIDHLSALLVRLSGRRIPSPCRAADGVLRVIAKGPDYASMVALAFSAITHHVGTHATVFERLLRAIGRIAEATAEPARRAVLDRQLDAVLERMAGADLVPQAKTGLMQLGRELHHALTAPRSAP